MKPLRIAFLISLYIFTAFTFANTDDITSKNTKISQSIEVAMEKFQIPGVAVAIVKDNKVVMSKGFGVTEYGTSNKVNGDTLFGIASNTKAMTAALLANLVDQGKLTWNTKVIDIIPEFQMPNPYVTREFTIIDLLAHNSGLGLGAGDLMIWPGTSLTTQDIIKGIKYLPEVSSFRSEFAYDNLMYIIAGEIIAKLSGKSWQDTIQDEIFTPLGMEKTRAKFSLISSQNKNVARAHVPLNDQLNVVGGDFLEQFSSAGSVASSVNDMSKWLKAQLNQGAYGDTSKALPQRLFSQEQSQFMWQVKTTLPVSQAATEKNKTHFSGYGLGWFLNDYHGVKLVHHSGGILGMVSKVVLVPEENLGMVILTNQQSGSAFNAIYHQILNEYLALPEKDWVEYYYQRSLSYKEAEKNRLAAAEKAIDKSAKASLPLSSYAQTYVDNWYGEIHITLENNILEMQFGNTPALKGTIEHYQHNTFIVRWDDRTLEADAFINFNLNEDASINYATMKAVSHATDFSFDFHDLKLQPKK